MSRKNKKSKKHEVHHDKDDKEIKNIKQMCVNNNCPNNMLDKNIKNFINKKINNEQKETEKTTLIYIYYKNQVLANYEIEERIIKIFY